MEINKLEGFFKPTNHNKILSEINEQSSYQKDMNSYYELGYAHGIVDILKGVENHMDKEIFSIMIESLDDENSPKYVKRLWDDR